ncbi:MAG: 23S rRNA (pseudouridine(1915)-N(3))-methyltransferase RlmH [Clostridia bacterium]|nr:23S rRNA (pseudouridine(1915)-N(3))-methyltransferase RlmH [Clostridia bacterium]
MIKVKIIALGKLKEDYLRKACDEYKKRLSRYCSLEIEEIAPVKLPDSPNSAQIKTALEKEAELIEKNILKGAFTVAFCIEGKVMSSKCFSDFLSKKSNEGAKICFIIGSSYGLDERIKNTADLKLSLSQMTFPHQLFRVMCLEQIYRAFKINEGGTYHK